MKQFLTGIVFLIMISSVAYAEKVRNPFPLPADAYSAAFETGSFSSMLNPVFTDSPLAPDIAYRYTSTEGDSSHFTMIDLFSFAFQYSWYDSVYNYSADLPVNTKTGILSISRGFIFGNTIGFGAGYSAGLTGRDGYEDYSGWNAGFLFRPAPFVSLGVSFRDLFGRLDGEDIEVTGTYSLALRPFGDRFTFSADMITGSAANEGDPYYSFAGEMKLRNMITISLRGDTLENYTAGIVIPLDTRLSSPVNIAPDFYLSHNDTGRDFYSTGAAIRFKRMKSAVLPVTKNILYIKLESEYGENDVPGMFNRPKPEFLDLIQGIMKAADDPGINSMILETGEVTEGFARLQELRSAMNYFKSRGKKLYAIMNYTGNKEYYIASCADTVYMPPNSEFAITGLSVHVYFFRGLLDMAGIKYESIRRGDYKSFNEPFTRDKMSPEARANLNGILTDLNEQFISGITERKLISREKVRELFDTGFYTPDEAKAKGFIDEVMYREDAVDSLAENNAIIDFNSYIEEETATGTWGPVPSIAIVYVNGTIVSGSGKKGGVSESIGDYDYNEALEAAFTDSGIKGVIIRINSGGGSAVASDFMWKSLVYLKKKYPKPVVISFGNMAASGGYYIACSGDRIFAENGTITGSIGVIAGKISVKELYAKLGINRDSISLSEFADIFDESRPLTEKEFTMLDREIGFTYDRFTHKVIEARKIPAQEIEKIAGGRVHTGLAARDNGLVDEEGGIYAAIEYCRSECGITGEYRVMQFPDNSSFLRDFKQKLAGSSYGIPDIFIKAMKAYNLLDGQALYLQPFIMEIE